MTTIQTARSLRMSLTWPALFRAVRLFLFGLIGWLLLISKADSASRGVSLAAVLALAALVGVMWYLSRAHADRRWRAALDAYAKQEQAKGTYSRRNFHARPQPQGR
jgi:predicted membrane channel-forming protein YqfA (hemolysin III family)